MALPSSDGYGQWRGRGAGHPLRPLGGRRRDRVRRARLGSAAAGRRVLAEPPAVRLAEPGLAALPRRARPDRHRGPLRRTGSRPVGPRGDRPQPRGPGRRPGGGRRRRRAGPVRPARHGAGRAGGDRVRRAAPGAADPARVLRQLRRRAGGRHAGGARARRGVRDADQGRLGATDLGVPPGLHQHDDPRRDRGADALDRRPAADGGRRGHRGPGPVAAPGDRLQRPAGRARPADPGAAQPRRPDEPLRATAGTWRRTSAGPGWWRWRATTTSCSRTSRPGRCSCAS